MSDLVLPEVFDLNLKNAELVADILDEAIRIQIIRDTRLPAMSTLAEDLRGWIARYVVKE